MRILLRLQALRNIEYQNDYHHKLRGRILKGIKGSEFNDLHDENTVKFNFSNPFPRENYNEGDSAKVIISSPHNPMINILSDHFRKNSEFNIGEMPFKIQNVSKFSTDVGEPMTNGKLQSSVGINLKLNEQDLEKYNIEYHSNQASWEPEFGIDIFKNKILETTGWKLNELYSDEYPKPSNFNDLFDNVEFGNVYPIEIPINNDYTETLLTVQSTFEYSIENDHHRRWLNTIVNCGLGNRNPYGFGFVNITDKEHPVNDVNI